MLFSKTSVHDYENLCSLAAKEGIVEKIDEVCEQEIAGREKVFYLPHRPVIRESAKATKLRIVYDASSKPTKNSASLNDCLETDPHFQNSMWYILVRSRFKYILLCGDVEKVFLQIKIWESERNILCFH